MTKIKPQPKATEVIIIRLSKDEKQAFKELVESHGSTMSKYLRQCIKEVLN